MSEDTLPIVERLREHALYHDKIFMPTKRDLDASKVSTSAADAIEMLARALEPWECYCDGECSHGGIMERCENGGAKLALDNVRAMR